MSCVGSPTDGSHEAVRPQPAAWEHAGWVLFATVLGSSMEFIDGTVVNVALPAIQETYRADAAHTEWVVASYGLLLSAVLLLAGALGDRFGQRRVFGIGIAAFALASSWCAVAPSMSQLLLARALQGLGGACLVANSLAFLNNSTAPEGRGKAIATWSAAASLMTASGPLLGGWIVQHASWRWVFLINVPTAAVALWATLFRTREVRNHTHVRRLDLTGALLGTLSLASLTLGLIEWDSLPRRAHIACLLGVLLGVLFLLWEARTSAPLLPLKLFRNRTFVGTNLVTFLLYGALSPLFYYLPMRLIQIHHLSPQRTGAAMLPLVLTLSLLSRRSALLSHRLGVRAMLTLGPTCVGAGLLLLAHAGLNRDYWTQIAPGLFLVGLGLAITVSPLTTAVMSSVRSERAGVASGINNAVAQVAALLILAISTPVFQHRFDAALTTQLAATSISAPTQQAILLQHTRLGAIKTQDSVQRGAVDRAYAESFTTVISLAGMLALLAAGAGVALLKPVTTTRASN